MKKLFTAGMIAVLAIATGVASVQARTPQPTSGTAGPLTWRYDAAQNVLTISGQGDMSDYADISVNTMQTAPIPPWSFCRKRLRKVVVEDGVKSIGRNAFMGFSMETVILSDGITRIGGGAFSNCFRLSAINIPAGVTRIEDGTFSSCEKLDSIPLPAGLTEIGSVAFYCSSLTNVTIPEGVKRIGSQAFSHCDNLSSVTLPDGLVAIGEDAFNKCKHLKHLNAGMKIPPAISETVFAEVPIADVVLTVPKGAKAAYVAAPVWKEFKQIAESTANVGLSDARIYSADGRLHLRLTQPAPVQVYSISGTLLRSFVAPAGETSVALPPGIYIVRASDRTKKVLVN